jgi:hypothetical protein
MQAQTTQIERQWTEGAGDQPEHMHPARVHLHDHYHVAHHHSNDRWLSGSIEPPGVPTSTTTANFKHSHEYDQRDEEEQHGNRPTFTITPRPIVRGLSEWRARQHPRADS